MKRVIGINVYHDSWQINIVKRNEYDLSSKISEHQFSRRDNVTHGIVQVRQLSDIISVRHNMDVRLPQYVEFSDLQPHPTCLLRPMTRATKSWLRLRMNLLSDKGSSRSMGISQLHCRFGTAIASLNVYRTTNHTIRTSLFLASISCIFLFEIERRWTTYNVEKRIILWV